MSYNPTEITNEAAANPCYGTGQYGEWRDGSYVTTNKQANSDASRS